MEQTRVKVKRISNPCHFAGLPAIHGATANAGSGQTLRYRGGAYRGR